MPFRDLRGHRRVISLLARSVARDSLPPSLIFAGPEGVGKRETAIALAQALNCVQSTVHGLESKVGSRKSMVDSTLDPGPWTNDYPDACGVCSACTRIARGVFPDVLIVEPGESGSIKIDQIRDAIDQAAYRPFEGKRRVVIIDEADALVGSAQNALLKTLEEPPPSSVFILLTSRPDMLLPTVRSRCIRLTFPAADASPIDEGARALAERVLAEAAAVPDARRRIDTARQLAPSAGGGAADREQLASSLHAMAALVRDVEALAAGADAALANSDAKPIIERLLPAYRGERGIRVFKAIDAALEALDRNASPKIVADWLVLEL